MNSELRREHSGLAEVLLIAACNRSEYLGEGVNLSVCVMLRVERLSIDRPHSVRNLRILLPNSWFCLQLSGDLSSLQFHQNLPIGKLLDDIVVEELVVVQHLAIIVPRKGAESVLECNGLAVACAKVEHQCEEQRHSGRSVLQGQEKLTVSLLEERAVKQKELGNCLRTSRLDPAVNGSHTEFIEHVQLEQVAF